MKFVNLTSRDLAVFGIYKKINVFAKSEQPAIVVLRFFTHIKTESNIPLYVARVREVRNLPMQQHGVMYIVEPEVKEFEYLRTDLVSPGQEVRDAAGAVIGCKGFIV